MEQTLTASFFFPVIHHFLVVPQLNQRTGVHTIEPVHLFNDPGLQRKAVNAELCCSNCVAETVRTMFRPTLFGGSS